MAKRSRRKARSKRSAPAAPTVPDAVPEVAGSVETSSPTGFSYGLWILFAVALALRLLHVAAINGAEQGSLLLGDAESYYQWALRIAAGDWRGSEVFYQAPLYPYFIGALFSLFEPDPGTIRWTQAFLGAAACVLVALAGRRWFSPAAGLIAGALLAVYAPAVFFSGLVQKTSLALFLFALLLWLVARATSRGSAAAWLAVGACLAATALARENALVLIVPVLAWIALGPAQTAPWGRVRGAGAVAVGLVLILGPVGWRNYSISGELALTTSQLGTNLYIGNNETANGSYRPLRAGRDDPRFERVDARAVAEAKSGRALTPKQVSSFFVGEVARYVGSSPGDWGRLMGRKTLLALNAVELADTEDLDSHREHSFVLHALAPVAHFGWLLPLAAAGIILQWSRRRETWFLHFVLVAYGASLVAFFIFARYRFPLVPILMLFAAAGVVEARRRFARADWTSLAPAIAAAVVAIVVTNVALLDVRSMRAVTQFNYGWGFQQEGREDLARDHYARAVALRPSFGEAHYRLGVLEASNGDTDTAIARFESALIHAPQLPDVRTSLGTLLAQRGDHDRAEAQFREALRLAPRDVQALNNLAGLAFSRRKLDEARALYQRSIQLDPSNPQTHNNLGIIAAIERQLPRAVEHFRSALELDPGYEEARENLARALSAT